MNKQNVEIILQRDHMQPFLKAYTQKLLYGTSHVAKCFKKLNTKFLFYLFVVSPQTQTLPNVQVSYLK